MTQSTHLPGRRRTLDRNKKTLLCDAVSRGATMTEAAITVGVSLRTVQREARLDPDFDQKLRIAHTDKPDPLTMMQSAARTHWRAAAWLLERSNPENYGRRSATSCTPFQFEEAIKGVVEAALRITNPENRAAVYAELTAASETAFKAVFPNYGPCGRRLVERLPDTPLTDEEQLRRLTDPQFQRVVFENETCRITKPSLDEQLPWRAGPSPAPAPREVGWVDRAAATHQVQTPNDTPHSQATQHPAPSIKHPPSQTPDSRLSWQYNLRAARTNPLASRTPTSASITHPPILSHLSPKTAPATEFRISGGIPSPRTHSETTPTPVK